MKLKSILAVLISLVMVVESVPAAPLSPAGASTFSVAIPSSLGFVSESYSPSPIRNTPPDMILIQNLHVNRSVQFAISGILKRLKEQGLMPDRIAMEGATGPIDITAMQRYPDPEIRKEAADYLVQQGEMPGAMHFAVTEGVGGLFGIETDEYYQANLEMFRRSYKERVALRRELEKIQAVLPKLEKDPATRGNAVILEKDISAVNELINNQVTPEDLYANLKQTRQAIEHLKLVLPQQTDANLLEPLSASVNFYALALLRDEELFKNTLSVRELGHQKTSIVVTGGFHTKGLTEQCKRQGLSYIVITPNVKRHDKVDENLYVQRLLGHHLSPEQVEQGLDWASMRMLEEAFDGVVQKLWPDSVRQAIQLHHPLRRAVGFINTKISIPDTLKVLLKLSSVGSVILVTAGFAYLQDVSLSFPQVAVTVSLLLAVGLAGLALAVWLVRREVSHLKQKAAAPATVDQIARWQVIDEDWYGHPNEGYLFAHYELAGFEKPVLTAVDFFDLIQDGLANPDNYVVGPSDDGLRTRINKLSAAPPTANQGEVIPWTVIESRTYEAGASMDDYIFDDNLDIEIPTTLQEVRQLATAAILGDDRYTHLVAIESGLKVRIRRLQETRYQPDAPGQSHHEAIPGKIFHLAYTESQKLPIGFSRYKLDLHNRPTFETVKKMWGELKKKDAIWLVTMEPPLEDVPEVPVAFDVENQPHRILVMLTADERFQRNYLRSLTFETRTVPRFKRIDMLRVGSVDLLMNPSKTDSTPLGSISPSTAIQGKEPSLTWLYAGEFRTSIKVYSVTSELPKIIVPVVDDKPIMDLKAKAVKPTNKAFEGFSIQEDPLTVSHVDYWIDVNLLTEPPVVQPKDTGMSPGKILGMVAIAGGLLFLVGALSSTSAAMDTSTISHAAHVVPTQIATHVSLAGSSAVVAHGTVAAVLHYVTSLLSLHSIHEATFALLHTKLISIDLRKIGALPGGLAATLFAIPVGIVLNYEEMKRWQQKLKVMKDQAFTQIAA